MKPDLLINPRMKWACPPSEQGRLKFVEGRTDDWPPLPKEGDVLTLPFIQDPLTGQPVAVRVLQIQTLRDQQGHILAVVVARADPHH